jgi:hypothetical protein
VVLLAASIISRFAEGLGLIATAIAIFGFLAHAPLALRGHDEKSLREATVRGGLTGFASATLVIVLSVMGVL